MTTLLTRTPTQTRSTIEKWSKGVAVNVSDTSDTYEILERAGLDWRLECSPTFYGPDKKIKSPYHTVRRMDIEGEEGFLYTAKDRTVWQNDEIVESFQSFCENAGLKLNYLGYLPSPQNLLIGAAKIPFEMAPKIDPRDRTDCYLLLTEAHKNNKALYVGVFMVRLVCTNGQTITVPLNKGKVAHKTVAYPKQKVSKYVDSAMSTLRRQKKIIDGLSEKKIDEQVVISNLIDYFQATKTRYSTVVDESDVEVQACLGLFKGDAMGSHYESAQNTYFQLYHVLNEWENHRARLMNGRKATSDVAHMRSLLDGAKKRRLQQFQDRLVQQARISL